MSIYCIKSGNGRNIDIKIVSPEWVEEKFRVCTAESKEVIRIAKEQHKQVSAVLAYTPFGRYIVKLSIAGDRE